MVSPGPWADEGQEQWIERGARGPSVPKDAHTLISLGDQFGDQFGYCGYSGYWSPT